ncbi:unnamed protein product [Phytophthora fragariaefolia]|uniref:Unnamed protein product n=1 Tax=Phytophthora fragariaefolia TaxID=1490495 RepID=A0A9W6Y8E1_9STRA|nr:unnamed protein product [Phytophthora fragariaefolia]
MISRVDAGLPIFRRQLCIGKYKSFTEISKFLKVLPSSSKLQAEDLSLADVRALFDSVAQRFPSMKPQLNASASSVHSPVFESAAVEVLNGDVRLSTGERAAIKAFEKSSSSQEDGRGATVSGGLLGASYEAPANEYPLTAILTGKADTDATAIIVVPINMELLIFLRSSRSSCLPRQHWAAAPALDLIAAARPIAVAAACRQPVLTAAACLSPTAAATSCLSSSDPRASLGHSLQAPASGALRRDWLWYRLRDKRQDRGPRSAAASTAVSSGNLGLGPTGGDFLKYEC